MRPTCINHGCEKLVIPRTGSIYDANPRWRIHCGHCQQASYGKHPHALGVTPYKTGRCTNVDSHLGFECTVDWSKVPADAKGMTEVDHIDGNPSNNSPDNLDELCVICHKIKSQRNGDYNGFKAHNVVKLRA